MIDQLTEEQFDSLRRILSRAAGLHFDDGRRLSLTYSVRSRMEESGCADVDTYLRLLSDLDSEGEMQRLLDEATVQETHFFRNLPQVRALRRHVLPELYERARAAGRPLTIWSAGCATGEEPYTIAMLVRELWPSATREHVTILATDVSTAALEVAEAATYGPRAIAMVEPDDIARWFHRHHDDSRSSTAASGRVEQDTYEVRDDVRDLVTFRHHNLVTQAPPVPPGQLDLLLCRNVTIYFNRSTTRALMARFHSTLAEGGYLFLGHSETLWQLSDAFTLVPLGDAFVYRKDSTGHRRGTLPDRRAVDEPPPVLVGDRRSSGADRRRKPVEAEKRLPAKPGADELLIIAREALAAGRYAQAVEHAEAAARLDPLRAPVHLVAGQALANLGRHAEAAQALRKVIYLDPACSSAHLLLAGSLDRIGQRAAAARSYRLAAAGLVSESPATLAVLFEGRRVDELVALCVQLAEQAENAGKGE